jgi:hypothetical protein
MSVEALVIIYRILGGDKPQTAKKVIEMLIEGNKLAGFSPNDVLFAYIEDAVKDTNFAVTLNDCDKSYDTIEKAIQKMNRLLLHDSKIGMSYNREFKFIFNNHNKHCSYVRAVISKKLSSSNKYFYKLECNKTVIVKKTIEGLLRITIDTLSLIIRMRYFTSTESGYDPMSEGRSKTLDDIAKMENFKEMLNEYELFITTQNRNCKNCGNYENCGNYKDYFYERNGV